MTRTKGKLIQPTWHLPKPNDLLDRVDEVKYEPDFTKEADGWYVSTLIREPSGPYPTFRAAIEALLADVFD